MNNQSKILRESSELFIYCFFLIFATFTLELIYDLILPYPFLLAPFFIIKIFLYSGILGSILEMVSGQELYFQRSRVIENAKKLWIPYVAVNFLGYSTALFLGAILPFTEYNFVNSLVAHIQLILVCTLLYWFIEIKYLKPLNLKAKKIKINSSILVTLLTFYTFDLAAFYLPKFLNLEHLDYWPVLFACARHFLYFFEFIFLAYLICNQYPEIFKE